MPFEISVLNPESRMPNPEPLILNAESGILNLESGNAEAHLPGQALFTLTFPSSRPPFRGYSGPSAGWFALATVSEASSPGLGRVPTTAALRFRSLLPRPGLPGTPDPRPPIIAPP